MKLGSASLFSRLCCGLSMAVLALAVSLDGFHAVRAEGTDDYLISSLQELIVDPLTKTIHSLEDRLTRLEAMMDTTAQTFSSRSVVARVLCVSDETGAQTCITKAQLDTILSGISRAEISQPSIAVTEAKVVPAEEAVETTVTKDTSRYQDPSSAVEEKSSVDQDPEHTGTTQSAFSGAAIVFTPEVEITEDAAPERPTPAEPAPVQAIASEPVAQSDDQ
jgi:hypothetical protein